MGSHFQMLIKIHFGCACLAAYRLELRQPTAVGTAKVVYNRVCVCVSLSLSLSRARDWSVVAAGFVFYDGFSSPLHPQQHPFFLWAPLHLFYLPYKPHKARSLWAWLGRNSFLEAFPIACFKLETCISSLFLKQLFPSVLIVSWSENLPILSLS